MILSYAQNMEDYTLAQLFAGEGPGVYIDIGGGPPVADNVTFWFYLAGWRGLVVEPQKRLAEAYAHIRPRDVVFNGLVGAKQGDAAFHEVDRLHGFSTTVAENAEGAAEFGAGFRTLTLPMATLAQLCERHGLTQIDILKIDVEGAEADVIAGNDWTRFRPRVLCIEAVAPRTMAPAWEHWEPPLTEAGYRFAYFDNLNRFYVAQEASELLERFPDGPPDWGAVAHLYQFGRPLAGPASADHALAKALVDGFLALAPGLDRDLLVRCLLAARPDLDAAAARALVLGDPALLDPIVEKLPAPSTDLAAEFAALLASDAGRAALGRIASFHDGGHVLED